MKSTVIAVIAMFTINAASTQFPDYSILKQDEFGLSDGASEQLSLKSFVSKLLEKAEKWYPMVKKGAKGLLKAFVALEEVVTPKNIEKAMLLLQAVGVVDEEFADKAVNAGATYQDMVKFANKLQGKQKEEALESAETTKKLFLSNAIEALGQDEAKVNEFLKRLE